MEHRPDLPRAPHVKKKLSGWRKHSFRCLPSLVLMPSIPLWEAFLIVVEGISITRGRHQNGPWKASL